MKAPTNRADSAVSIRSRPSLQARPLSDGRFKLLSTSAGVLFACILVACATGIPTSYGQTNDSSLDRLQAIDGQTFEGEISAVIDGVVKLADERQVPLNGLLQIERSSIRNTAAGPIQIRLTGGGVLRARDLSIENESAVVKTDFGQFELPIEMLRSIVFRGAQDLPMVQNAINNPSTQSDIVIAETDQGPAREEGLLESLAGGDLTGEFGGQRRTVSRDRLIAVVIADLQLPRDTAAVHKLRLADQSEFHTRIERLDQDQLTIEWGGKSCEIPWSQVQAIEVGSDRLVWLSSLEPREAYQQPLVTPSMPWQRDRSVGGNPLTLVSPTTNSSRQFSKGIGVHAYSRMTYDIDRQYQKFVAVLGIDAETRGQGDCVFVVSGDGVTLWTQRIRATDDPVPVELDISGVDELSLVVEPGELLDMADHANWADARLLKTP